MPDNKSVSVPDSIKVTLETLWAFVWRGWLISIVSIKSILHYLPWWHWHPIFHEYNNSPQYGGYTEPPMLSNILNVGEMFVGRVCVAAYMVTFWHPWL